MIFSSITFLFLFLPIVFGIYSILPNLMLKNIFLMISSLVFYAWGEPLFVFLMLVSVFCNWCIGLLMQKYNKNFLLGVAILLNIGLLFYFKYFNFIADLLHINISEIRLPIGISFFTFQALSYVIDVKRGSVEVQKNYFNLLLYISLFPQLIAGPIVRYQDVDQQIKERTITIDKIASGIKLFIFGLGKKVLIANNMAIMVDTIFEMNPNELNIILAWIGAIAYVFQIYFDFSGYSDMARGLGRMFGFEFKENFNYPLTATSLRDFWRRWHMSLTGWFREYLYIPLGGNRKGDNRKYINTMIVFFATGLWHGANWTFLVWGVVHGLFVVMESIVGIDNVKSILLKRIYTLVVVTLLFVVFRADSLGYAMAYIGQMFMGFDVSKQSTIVQLLNPYTIFISIVAMFLAFKWITIKSSYVCSIFILIFSILSLASNAYNPFIYFIF
ncbi:MAG: hypothetical protein ATN35_03380 [Epulopiscium sp. Nele67-Bin004]|nr:MAG: hypothetical protein ATN35_03380 [Epulopiscium sp. Nele67-Bin004]